MALGERELEFVQSAKVVAMMTVGRDGFAKPARIGVTMVDGRLWSSSTADRVRTARLRRDPRTTLLVMDEQFRYLSLECTVTILDGDNVPELSLRLFRQMQGKPEGPLSWFGGELDEPEFLAKMVEERRLIYEFDVQKTYGLY